MKDKSRLIFVSRDQKRIKEFKISRIKLFTYISIFLIAFLITGKLGLDMLINFSQNSKINRLQRTNTVLQSRIKEISKKIKNINNEMNLLVEKDDQLRAVIGLEELSPDVRNVGIGGAKYDYDLSDEISGFDEKVELENQLMEVSKIEREVTLELESYHELITTFQKKQDSLKYLPALRPVLKGFTSSGFGMRMHPILKVRRHHDGLDISVKKGTPIYASADGVVTFHGKNGGYGNMVIVNHKYGYETRYGHMSKITARKGEKVKRGEKIGEVGRSGLATASHLHYEVRFKGKAVNPNIYYFEDKILNKKVVKKD